MIMKSKPKIKYLIDTNIYGLSFRENHKQIVNFLKTLGDEEVVVSCFVLGEIEALRFTFFHPNFISLCNYLKTLDISWFTINELNAFAFLKYIMSQKKITNRTIDYLLASQCLINDYTLVTANKKDFDQIPNLKTKFYDQANNRWY